MARISHAERKARTRQRLLDAAYEMIVEEGLMSLSLDRIAERAGLTRGAVYSNFANKADLFAALTLQVRQELRPFDIDQPIADQLVEGGHRAAAALDSAWPAFSILQLESALFIGRNPALIEQWQRWQDDDVDRVADSLDRAAAAQGEALPADARSVVLMLVAFGFGVQQLKLLAPELDLAALIPLAYQLLGGPVDDRLPATPTAKRRSRSPMKSG